jgi:transcriptional regulator with XRE-family HTH domain
VDRLGDVTTQIGPGLRRRQLAAFLSDFRATAKKSQAEAAFAADCSRSQISFFESGRYVPSRLELPALLECYGVPRDRWAALEDLRAAANEPGWWSDYGLPPWLQSYVRLETDATQVRCFALELVPGLVQTEDYARAVQHLYGATEADTRRRVAVLTERQKRVGKGLSLSVVVSEGLLPRTAAMGPVGREQLTHLADLVEDEVATVRVLPYAVGLHRGMSSQFTVLDFPLEVPSVGYQEHAVGGHLIDDADVVSKLATLYQELLDTALGVDGSVEKIRGASVPGE